MSKNVETAPAEAEAVVTPRIELTRYVEEKRANIYTDTIAQLVQVDSEVPDSEPRPALDITIPTAVAGKHKGYIAAAANDANKTARFRKIEEKGSDTTFTITLSEKHKRGPRKPKSASVDESASVDAEVSA